MSNICSTMRGCMKGTDNTKRVATAGKYRTARDLLNYCPLMLVLVPLRFRSRLTGLTAKVALRHGSQLKRPLFHPSSLCPLINWKTGFRVANRAKNQLKHCHTRILQVLLNEVCRQPMKLSRMVLYEVCRQQPMKRTRTVL